MKTKNVFEESTKTVKDLQSEAVYHIMYAIYGDRGFVNCKEDGGDKVTEWIVAYKMLFGEKEWSEMEKQMGPEMKKRVEREDAEYKERCEKERQRKINEGVNE